MAKIDKSKIISNRTFQGLILLALFIGVGFGALISLAAKPNSTSNSNSNYVSQNKDLYNQGETSTKEGLSFTINKVSTDTVGDEVYKPNPNHKFAVLDVTISNNSSAQIPIVPVTQMYLKKDDGTIYYINPAPMVSPLAGGNLPSGENIKGQISFEIPSSITNAKFVFDSGWANTSPSVFSISL